MTKDTIIFVDKILDNVHGFIEFTEAEHKIMNLLIFKRLQSIKQLSLVNWVFPGSEHTRFIHSLGVMYIADKIAKQLNLSVRERKIVRLAGLLHDIGHYPLSHVCEFPYKKKMMQFSSQNYCNEINQQILNAIDELDKKQNIEFMIPAKQGHHEEIGSLVIKNNKEIKNIIIEECGEDSIEIICDMITGNVRNNPNTGLLVQILHSELDADGIDYMLRDSVFSGTTFGNFEVEQLIQCMTVRKYNDKPILCILPKGISAADQYLINKFFFYSQVVFNKHTIALEWMAEQIVSWMQENSTYFPSKKDLRTNWIKNNQSEKFLDFTDNFFWTSIRNIVENPARQTFPQHIIFLCEKLLHHQELSFIDNSEYKIVSNDYLKISEFMKSSKFYKDDSNLDDKVTILSIREMTKHIPYYKYMSLLKIPEETNDALSNTEFETYKINMNTLRLMDGICVEDSNDLHLLCDDKRSLMQQMCDTKLVIMRSYEFMK